MQQGAQVAWFNYDWFTGEAFVAQKREARLRCAQKKFPNVPPDQADQHSAYQTFLGELEVRTLVYLRDGFSYEMTRMVDIGQRADLFTFECEPIDEQYKVGAFVVTLPYDEINRVETFAVHPSEKPEDVPVITGFRSSPADASLYRDDARDTRDELKSPGPAEADSN